MSTKRAVLNRWVIVFGAVMIQLALGAIYAWSVFTKLLTEPDGAYRFSASQAAWVFSASLAVFAVVMVFAGRWQARFGPRPVSLLGGIALGLGYVLGGLFGGSFWAQLLFIGIMGGAGIGLAYVVPIAVGVKWFPDKKGLITGLAVAGFGFGATIWVKRDRGSADCSTPPTCSGYRGCRVCSSSTESLSSRWWCWEAWSW